MNRAFRKYHRQIAIILCLPLFVTVLTGMCFTLVHEWFHQRKLGQFILQIHTLEIIHLEKIYPILNGLGLIGLLNYWFEYDRLISSTLKFTNQSIVWSFKT